MKKTLPFIIANVTFLGLLLEIIFNLFNSSQTNSSDFYFLVYLQNGMSSFLTNIFINTFQKTMNFVLLLSLRNRFCMTQNHSIYLFLST